MQSIRIGLAMEENLHTQNSQDVADDQSGVIFLHNITKVSNINNVIFPMKIIWYCPKNVQHI